MKFIGYDLKFNILHNKVQLYDELITAKINCCCSCSDCLDFLNTGGILIFDYFQTIHYVYSGKYILPLIYHIFYMKKVIVEDMTPTPLYPRYSAPLM